ncbi:hypothetical protein Pfo_012599 [Paulownia fortunei]|nr:hypothetical protein Pfo_012599 [Paulownia fortunei]
MKEAGRDRGGGNNGSVRSAVEKERTKMRERQRRSITTNIFHGLRKHGGYRLSPRADINEVLRHLAQEAGWIVEPDGTTYRSPTISNGTNACPLCGGGRKSAPPTPSCSYLGGAGECSTTTSPRRVTIGDSAVNNLSSGGLPSLSSNSVMATNDTLLAIYMCGAAPQNACASDAAYGKGQQLYLLHEASVSNQNTPAGSP